MNIKRFFETPKKAVISSLCIAAVIVAAGAGSVYAAGAIAESFAIGADNAKKFAFADAGIDPVSAQAVRTKFELENGQFVYEVDFYADGTEYEYLIKASNGLVVKKDVEVKIPANTIQIPTDSETIVSLDTAKQTALTDAGLSEAAVTFTDQKLDRDDGRMMYEIDFYTSDTKYEYEINAKTGDIFSKSKEALPATGNVVTSLPATAEPNPPQTESTTSAASSQISIEEAKNIALADAGVSSSAATFTKSKLDIDDGVYVYDIEFYTDDTEYEYEITRDTGAVRSKSSEPFRNASGQINSNDFQSSQISEDEAKNIALADAGVSSSAATFTKSKLDIDDGVYVYDIEFYTSDREYDYEINRDTGAVRSKSFESFNNGTSQGTINGDLSAYISLDEAKTIAVNKAGVSISNVTFKKAKMDHDDGRMVYEMEFYSGRTEYECEIDASTGTVLDFDFDYGD